MGAFLAAYGAFHMRLSRRTERDLRARGVLLAEPPPLIPIVRLSFVAKAGPGEALRCACLGLREAERAPPGPVHIYGVKVRGNEVRAKVAPWIIFPVTAWAMTSEVIRVVAMERAGGSELRVTIWPATLDRGAVLADAVSEAIRSRLELAPA